MCYPGMVYIKDTLLLIGKKVAHVTAAAGFLSHCLNGPLPYVRRHITVNKMFSALLNKAFPSYFKSPRSHSPCDPIFP